MDKRMAAMMVVVVATMFGFGEALPDPVETVEQCISAITKHIESDEVEVTWGKMGRLVSIARDNPGKDDRWIRESEDCSILNRMVEKRSETTKNVMRFPVCRHNADDIWFTIEASGSEKAREVAEAYLTCNYGPYAKWRNDQKALLADVRKSLTKEKCIQELAKHFENLGDEEDLGYAWDLVLETRENPKGYSKSSDEAEDCSWLYTKMGQTKMASMIMYSRVYEKNEVDILKTLFETGSEKVKNVVEAHLVCNVGYVAEADEDDEAYKGYAEDKALWDIVSFKYEGTQKSESPAS